MDPNTHSPLPYFLRVRGSVLPKMIIPLLFVAGWATLVTCISKYVWNLGINSYLPHPPLKIFVQPPEFCSLQLASWLPWLLLSVLLLHTNGISMESSSSLIGVF